MRPSSGAALSERNGDVVKSGAAGWFKLAAPEDGRTPLEPSAAIDFSVISRLTEARFNGKVSLQSWKAF